MKKCTYNGFPVLLYGKLEQWEESPFTDAILCAVDGVNEVVEIPHELVELRELLPTSGDAPRIAIQFGADYQFKWALGYENSIDFEPEEYSTDLGSEDDVEARIASMGLTAPRIDKAHIEKMVKDVYFHVPPDTQLTICVLTLQNNYTVVGKSACVSPENFDERFGRDLAYKDAKSQIGALEGYLLAWALSSDKAN